MLITQILPGTILYFQYLSKRKKNKVNQSEIEVKMITKMKKHDLHAQIGKKFYEQY